MSYVSALGEEFLSTVDQWISSKGEVLVMIPFNEAGGGKSFEFFNSASAFRERLSKLPPRTCVIVFREKQLPLRGVVNARFISECLAAVPDGVEWLVTGLHKTHAGSASWFREAAGESHKELIEELESHPGEVLAAGLFPPWLYDSEVVVSAVLPEPDGSVVCGIY